ncbi:MAG: hypothetical protein IJM13_02315 [Lachnospiraceae bacterium]|nr:hypothetical protein [Lachnospiraceae bacterium]MBR0106034.1 hypothetical protein [Lachnospiraceae bacterium]MBR2738447.1 hypothetical protein [Lachnospiraceae bacterium]
MGKITKDMTLREIFDLDPFLETTLSRQGINALEGPAHYDDTLEKAMLDFGYYPDNVGITVDSLNMLLEMRSEG